MHLHRKNWGFSAGFHLLFIPCGLELLLQTNLQQFGSLLLMEKLDFHGDVDGAFTLLNSNLDFVCLCLLGQGGGVQWNTIDDKEKMNIKQ